MAFDIARIARFTTWALAALIVFLSVVPPDLRPETPAPHALEHIAIFAALGFAAGIGYHRRPMAVAIALATFAAFVEVVQLFVPGRHARLSDFAIDALAAIIGLIVAGLLGLIRAPS